MMKIKNKPGIWQFIFRITRYPFRLERGWRLFTFGIFKLRHELMEGDRIQDYEGFYCIIYFWLPFEIN